MLAFAAMSPDYKNMPLEQAMADLQARIANYEAVYEPVSNEDFSYIKLINLRSKIICNKIYGRFAHLIATHLMCCHIEPRPIYLVRSGHMDLASCEDCEGERRVDSYIVCVLLFRLSFELTMSRACSDPCCNENVGQLPESDSESPSDGGHTHVRQRRPRSASENIIWGGSGADTPAGERERESSDAGPSKPSPEAPLRSVSRRTKQRGSVITWGSPINSGSQPRSLIDIEPRCVFSILFNGELPPFTSPFKFRVFELKKNPFPPGAEPSPLQ